MASKSDEINQTLFHHTDLSDGVVGAHTRRGEADESAADGHGLDSLAA